MALQCIVFIQQATPVAYGRRSGQELPVCVSCVNWELAELNLLLAVYALDDWLSLSIIAARC